ncbi:uncharacterized protein LOC119727041 [Patiria miniata]|uniref:Uncharacterized protein n=1 Tax=Patiria miniata TaxID=46514 RepID=A0A913ZTD2_PATMI|nr:uncharacterized protein LOC119727041 [Patiria miniata]
MRQLAAELRPVITAGCVLVFLLLGGIPCTSGAGTVRSLPRVLNASLSEIRDYFCDSDMCRPGPACKLCRQDRDHDAYCEKPLEETSNGDCDWDQDLYCTYNDASVCVYDQDFSSSCMYYYTILGPLIYCVCDGSEVPRGLRCSDTTSAPTQQTRKPTTSSPPEATLPSSQTNVEAIIIGSVLSAVLLLVLLIIFWLCWTKKLTLLRRSQNAAGDAHDGTNSKDKDHPLKLQPRELGTNADQKPDSPGLLNPTYSTSLDLNQDHYYSKIRDEGGTPVEGRKRHAQDDHVRPSAPPIDTEAPADHHYFVLERDGEQVETDDQAGSPEEPNNHDYFVLEKDDSQHGNDYGENVNATDGATSRPRASADVSYDHIRRSEPGHSEDAPLSQVTGYDHIKRPGQNV